MSLSTKAYFHQLCSSDFVDKNSNWSNILYSYGIDDERPYDDFRVFALPQFLTLSLLCDAANRTFINNLVRFNSKILISKEVQSSDIVEFQVASEVTRFCRSTYERFVWMLDFVGNIAQGNGLDSFIQSIWYFQTLRKEDLAALWMKPRSCGNDNSCSCGTNFTCSSSAIINNYSISGFRIGCFVTNSLLQSTLECLYNLTCINLLESFYSIQDVRILPLNPNLSSPNETVQSLVAHLFIDTKQSNVSYEKYDETCSPRLCQYSIEERIHVLYTITAIIGFYRGLTVALEIVATILVNTGLFILRCQQNRIHPENVY
ncbi:unnamed protein product [Adineta ricciae]|uniref:Uncharacterized protein n=1 Tax=Adineta ricciae TaxID=249248 RepID=A0A814EXE8_ADIRI|nr:unnamed protein product [Adineta ricciae]CAF1271681.1 unnamed protein product [Adineta ricciae]